MDAMMKINLTEESTEKVNITSVRLQRIALVCKKCQKDTGAIYSEKTVVICESCQTAMRKDVCKKVHDMILSIETSDLSIE